MKKRLIAFGMMIVLVLCMSMTVFAADGLNTNEQNVLNAFKTLQNKYATLLGADTVTKNEATVTAVLNKYDFDQAACNDMVAIINKIDSYLAGKKITDKKALLAERDTLVSMVKGSTITGYNIDAAALTDKGIGSITITPASSPSPSGGGDSSSDDSTTVVPGQGIINQTGVDTTATVAVFGGIALISLLGIGAFVASRNKKVAR